MADRIAENKPVRPPARSLPVHSQGAADHTASATATLVPGGSHAIPDVEQVLESVFISPRIIEERSLAAFSATLRELVRDAVGQGKALASAGTEVRTLITSLREAAQELEQRTDGANRTAPLIDQRLTRAEQVLDMIGREISGRVKELKDLANVDRDTIRAAVREQTQAVIREALKEQLDEHLQWIREETIRVVEEQTAQSLELARAAARKAVEEETELALSAMREQIAAQATQVRDISDQLQTHWDDQAVRLKGILDRAAAAEERLAGTMEGAAATAERQIDRVAARLDDAIKAGEVARANPMLTPDGLREALETMQQMGTWLGQLIEQGDKVGRTLDRLSRTTHVRST